VILGLTLEWDVWGTPSEIILIQTATVPYDFAKLIFQQGCPIDWLEFYAQPYKE